MQMAKSAEPWKMNSAVGPTAADGILRSVTKALGVGADTPQDIPSQLLLQSALTACASLSQDNAPEIDALIAAFESHLGKSIYAEHGDSIDTEATRIIILLLKSVWSAVKLSDLIHVSTEAHLREAQQHAATALRVLQRTTKPSVDIYRSKSNTPAWPITAAKAFGAPLFIFVLLIVQSGQRVLLDTALAQIKNDLERSTDLDGSGVVNPEPMAVSRPLKLR
jgi:hypothetical protein